jgi:hypothetical protein
LAVRALLQHAEAAMAEQRSEWMFSKPGPWIDLGLTLPIFLVYHLGVVFLRVRNATDLFTAPLLQLAEGNTEMYLLITLGIGLGFAGVFYVLGRDAAKRLPTTYDPTKRSVMA